MLQTNTAVEGLSHQPQWPSVLLLMCSCWYCILCWFSSGRQSGRELVANRGMTAHLLPIIQTVALGPLKLSWRIETLVNLWTPAAPACLISVRRLQTATCYGFVSFGADRPAGGIHWRSLRERRPPFSEEIKPVPIRPVRDMDLD